MQAAAGAAGGRPKDTSIDGATQDGTQHVPDSGTINVDNSAGLPVTKPFAT